MKLLVLSDSHGRVGMLEKAYETHPDADMIVFLGDGLRDVSRAFTGCEKTVVCVRGNCDGITFDSSFAAHALEETILDLEGVRVLCCHGHRYGVKSGLSTIAEYADSKDIQLVLYGHTHTPAQTRCGGVVLFNPGRASTGSYGIVYLKDGAVLCSHGEV